MHQGGKTNYEGVSKISEKSWKSQKLLNAKAKG